MEYRVTNQMISKTDCWSRTKRSFILLGRIKWLKFCLCLIVFWVSASCLISPMKEYGLLAFRDFWTKIGLSFPDPSVDLSSKYALKNGTTKTHLLENSISGLMEVEQCQRAMNVTFLKTHKTASCTIQNIFLRFGKHWKLTLLIPLTGNYFGHPQPFHRSMVPKLKPGLSYNVLCHHQRWNFNQVKSVMPSDSKYVTILRDPVKVFESLYFYSQLQKFFKMDIMEFAKANESFIGHHKRRMRGLGLNQMSYDMGLDEKAFDNSSYVHSILDKLNSEFHLVMIAEVMDESLVLLRHLLCWDLDDVVVFHHNSRLPETKVKLNANTTSGLRWWNHVDQVIYDYFKEKLQMRVVSFGIDRMKSEVEKLRNRTREWYDYCVHSIRPAKYIEMKYRPYHPQTYGFILNRNITNSTCEDLVRSELPFSDQLRKNQLNRHYYVLKPRGKAKLKKNTWHPGHSKSKS